MTIRTFDENIETRAQLRAIVNEPSPLVSDKSIDHIDEICERFIAASPFLIVSARGKGVRTSVSPKGDAPGFVAVLDEKTLAIPDRLGNNRLDTFECLLEDSRVGLLFMIPGHGDTLRVSGRAGIVRDVALQNQLAVKGRPPALVLVVSVEDAFLHCAKSIIRSRLWQPAFWPPLDTVPSLARAMVTHGRLKTSRKEMQGIIDNDAERRLY